MQTIYSANKISNYFYGVIELRGLIPDEFAYVFRNICY